MIGIIFSFGTEIVEIRVNGSEVLFRTSQFTNFATIDGLKLDKSGVMEEFPDLKGKEDWREIARQRFKDKIKEFKTERERADYIINDLKKYGYVPMYEQRSGFRTKKLK